MSVVFAVSSVFTETVLLVAFVLVASLVLLAKLLHSVSELPASKFCARNFQGNRQQKSL